MPRKHTPRAHEMSDADRIAKNERNRLNRFARKGVAETHNQTCEAPGCGRPAPLAAADRHGYKPPNACSTSCAQRLIQIRIQNNKMPTKGW